MASRRLCPSVHPRRDVPCILSPSHPGSCTDGTHRWTLPQGAAEPVALAEEIVLTLAFRSGLTYERAYALGTMSSAEMLADLYTLADQPAGTFTVTFTVRDVPVPA